MSFRRKSMSLRFGLAARERTEQQEGTMPQLHLVRAQHSKNPLRRLHDEYCSTREKVGSPFSNCIKRASGCTVSIWARLLPDGLTPRFFASPGSSGLNILSENL
jgi:hypothetical protein